MHFRPLRGATIAVLVMLPLLIGLGVWQVQRLHWKEALLTEIDSHMRAPPISFSEARKLGPAAEYRHVALEGTFARGVDTFIFTTGLSGGAAMHVVTPLRLDKGGMLMVDRGLVPLTGQMQPGPYASATGHREIVGVWRTPDQPGLFTPAPDLAHRTWFSRDVVAMAHLDRVALAAPVIVEADATPNPGGWPRGGQTVIDIPNNHLSYALTWFALAGVLVGVYLAYHASLGRLSLRNRT